MRHLLKVSCFSSFIFLLTGSFLQSCNTEVKKTTDEKQQYVISDSLFKILKIDTVTKCQLVNAITLTGQVDYNQDNEVKIFPLISGNVQNIKVALGDYVKQGQVLGVISSSEMAGYSKDLSSAETNVQVTKKNLEATQEMAKSGLSSQLDVLAAQTAYDQAQAELNRSSRVINVNGGSKDGDYIIKAPISGFIVNKSVTNGMTIRTDNATDLFTISDLKNVWVWANVYESDIDKVHMGDDVSITTLSYPGKVFAGKVDRVMNVLDPTNKVMKIRVVLSNDNYELKPQMFASVTVTNKVNSDAICVSSGAIIFDNSQNYVLLYNSDSDVQIKPVQVINAIGDRTYISSGVQPGDKLIASQALFIYGALNN
ncbi:MAG TPA: efflux RND transporter periplasmic adaptor subunit [Ferruginibacter sp.]|jgi:cobalt-zinc-cadmium efflux system membrane fusion protein|nr:efflux RND transporter periplasmic adaptor subunit [Ferruginibacter sp.]